MISCLFINSLIMNSSQCNTNFSISDTSCSLKTLKKSRSDNYNRRYMSWNIVHFLDTVCEAITFICIHTHRTGKYVYDRIETTTKMKAQWRKQHRSLRLKKLFTYVLYFHQETWIFMYKNHKRWIHFEN